MTAALENFKAPLGLVDLKPAPGERLSIETRAPKARYSASLIGVLDGQSVLITPPKAGQRTALLNEGSQLTVRLMAGNRICAFNSKLVKVQHSPYGYWHLEYPEAVEIRRIRKHTRVPVQLFVSVDSYDDHGGHHAELPCSALCTDISLEGACVEAKQKLGEVGDRLYLTLRINVAGIDQVMLAPVELRNVQPAEGGAAKVVSHGIEFLELEEDSRLVLAGFVYQQFLHETGNLEL